MTPPHAAAGETAPGKPASPRRRLAIVLALTLAFAAVEVVGGLYSGSLALLADAGHMLTDSLAIALSYFAIWISGRAVSSRRTFGFRRAEILAAFVNALLLAMLALWIVKEALERLYNPRPVLDGVLLTVALAGLGINLAGYALLHRTARHNINVRAALWHILGDMLGSLGTVAAALVIRFTGWTGIDPLAGIAIAVLIGIGSGRILFDSTNLLLDSVPRNIDSLAVRGFLSSQPGVTAICDLHIWAVSGSENVLTAHLVVEQGADRDSLLQNLLGELRERFGLAHMTVQLESTPQDSCHHAW